jgi:hypothetical protein
MDREAPKIIRIIIKQGALSFHIVFSPSIHLQTMPFMWPAPILSCSSTLCSSYLIEQVKLCQPILPDPRQGSTRWCKAFAEVKTVPNKHLESLWCFSHIFNRLSYVFGLGTGLISDHPQYAFSSQLSTVSMIYPPKWVI